MSGGKSTAKKAETGVISTRIVTKKLSDLRFLPRNARYMTAAQFERLVENLRADGVLTSTPLIYKDTIYSGNHRVEAAIAAGIEECQCMELVGEIDEQRLTAIALSHNSIAGQDDLSILREMYESLGLEMKAYSGITDDIFNLDEIDVDSLSIGALKYEELLVLFLPEEKELWLEALKKLGKSQKVRTLLAAHYSDFDRVFDVISAAKKQLNIHNTAIAFRAMADLALQRLEQLEAEQQPEEDGKDG